jgi:hypothetical protein
MTRRTYVVLKMGFRIRVCLTYHQLLLSLVHIQHGIINLHELTACAIIASSDQGRNIGL